MPYPSELPKQLKPHVFKGSGVGIKHKTPPVSVKLPPEMDALVRSLPNQSAFIRAAIAEKLEREGMMNSQPMLDALPHDPNWIPRRGDRVIERATGKRWRIQKVNVESQWAIVVDNGKLEDWFYLDKIYPLGD
jgi:Arc/MetJ-type ribon-helix-helix transcriptional regulator